VIIIHLYYVQEKGIETFEKTQPDGKIKQVFFFDPDGESLWTCFPQRLGQIWLLMSYVTECPFMFLSLPKLVLLGSFYGRIFMIGRQRLRSSKLEGTGTVDGCSLACACIRCVGK